MRSVVITSIELRIDFTKLYTVPNGNEGTLPFAALLYVTGLFTIHVITFRKFMVRSRTSPSFPSFNITRTHYVTHFCTR